MTLPHHPLTPDALLEHQGWLRSLARSLVRDPGTADDLVQETLVTALTKPPQRVEAVRGWMARVLRNEAQQHARREGRRRRRDRVPRETQPARTPGEAAELADTQRRVIAAVLALDEPYRNAILLRFFEELPAPEAAAQLGVPVETYRTRVKRGMAQLRGALDAEYGDRRRWRLALVPLLGGGSVGAPPDGARPTSRIGTRSLQAGLLATLLVGATTGVVLVLAHLAGTEPAAEPAIPGPRDVAETARAERRRTRTRGSTSRPDRTRRAAGDRERERLAALPAQAAPPSRHVNVRDLAGAERVPDLAIRFTPTDDGEPRQHDVRSDTEGTLTLPEAVEGRFESLSKEWFVAHMPRNGSTDLWVYRTEMVDGRVRIRAKRRAGLNPTAIALSFELERTELAARAWISKEAAQAVATHVESLERGLAAPHADGRFFARLPRIAGLRLVGKAEAWAGPGVEVRWDPRGGTSAVPQLELAPQ